MRPRLSRRAFLQLSAAFGAAAALKPPRELVIASTLRLPVPHHYFVNAESLLAHGLSGFDLLLVPAHTAAALIGRGALQPLRGSPHRAHDPDGAFTVPYAHAVSALVYRGAQPSSLDDLWQRRALWPDDPRLVIGAALLRRGYSPNDTHPGHLAQVKDDLVNLRPTIVPDPVAGLRSAISTLALAPILISAGEAEPNSLPLSLATGEGPAKRVILPPGGAIFLEYDWVIPHSSPDADAARAFITEMTMPVTRNLQSVTCHLPLASCNVPPIPLMPLPSTARSQQAAIWSRVKNLSA